MESKIEASREPQADTWNKSLICWRTSSTGPQCLCVELHNEIHLFPYGYLQHAKFSSENGAESIQLQFQDQLVLAKGHGLKPLCEALCKFTVERIRTCPEELAGFGKGEGVIEKIEVQKRRKIAPAENSENL